MTASRHLPIDLLKLVAAQAIVLHHMAIYGPIAESLHAWMPGVMQVLEHDGRMAVQVFLVVGGYLSAQALMARQQRPWTQLTQRYVRLCLPFMVAIGLTMAAAAVVANSLPELVGASVSWAQLAAHASLLHGVLGFESITVGAWYVAIDLQLFAVLLALLCLPRWRWRSVAMLTTASLFGFNLDSGLDNWALYFFGAYGLGALVHRAQQQTRAGVFLLAVLALGALALAFAWRERLLVAWVTAALLALASVWPRMHPMDGTLARLIRALSQQSYALFLTHYSVLLLVNGLYDHHEPDAHWAPLGYFLLAWGLSNVAALPFYRWIEQPAGRWRSRFSVAPAPYRPA